MQGSTQWGLQSRGLDVYNAAMVTVALVLASFFAAVVICAIPVGAWVFLEVRRLRQAVIALYTQPVAPPPSPQDPFDNADMDVAEAIRAVYGGMN